MQVQLGCMTYVFSEFPLDTALESIAASGYRYVSLGLAPRTAPVPGERSGAAEGQSVRRRLADYGLEPICCFTPSVTADDGIDLFKRRLEFCHGAGIPYVIAMGAWGYREWPHTRFTPEEMASAAMVVNSAYAELAPFAEEAGVTILLKPHSGSTATAKECLETMQAINHPAVRIGYDAGNVRYYEGVTPEDDIVDILPYVRGLCLKDHQGPRANPNFPVPGEGAIDHRLLFERMKEAGFRGPMILERVDGTTKKVDLPLETVVERVTRARRNMEAALAAVGASVL